MKINCPFCDNSEIEVDHKSSIKRKDLQKCRAGSGNVVFSKEKWIVLEDCTKCGSSAKKIEKALNLGEDYKSPSHKNVLERLKKEDLPTRI